MMLALLYFDAQIKFITCSIRALLGVFFLRKAPKLLTVLVWSKPVCYCDVSHRIILNLWLHGLCAQISKCD